MKKQETIVERTIKRMIEETIDQEKRGWPPGCAGFYYQPERPQLSHDHNKNLKDGKE